MSQEPRKALVTGASQGLGAAVARRLAERGYRVTAVSRDPAKLGELVSGLHGGGHESLALDLSTHTGMDALTEKVRGEPFDVLVNNAGATRFGVLTQLGEEEIQGLLRLNLVAPALTSWAFARAARRGAILVNVTSIVGVVPVPGNALYSASKAGLQALTECLWYELQESGIRVLDFRPVSLRTGFHEKAGQGTMASGLMVDPDRAALTLVDSIEGRSDFVRGYGLTALAMELARRLLPRRWLLRLMGRRARRAGYFEGS